MDSESNQSGWLPFIVDLNGDGRYTITDFAIWAKNIFFLPGDWIIWKFAGTFPGAARFLELNTADYGGLLSNTLSIGFWAVVLLMLFLTWRFIRAIDDTLTGWFGMAAEGIKQRARIAMVKAKAGKNRHQTDDINFADDIQLSRAEFSVLRAHSDNSAEGPPDLADLASRLRIESKDMDKCLKRLMKYGLLEKTRKQGYLVTQTGGAYLVFKQLAQ